MATATARWAAAQRDMTTTMETGDDNDDDDGATTTMMMLTIRRWRRRKGKGNNEGRHCGRHKKEGRDKK